MPGKKRKKIVQDGWEFQVFDLTPSIIVGERKFKFYDENIFKDLEKRCKEMGLKTFFSISDTDKLKGRRKTACVEIYKRYPSPIPLEDMIENLLPILKEIFVF